MDLFKSKFPTPLVFAIILCGFCELLIAQQASQGLIDLRSVDFRKNQAVNLKGEWSFFWEKLLVPADFSEPSISENDGRTLIQAPGPWNRVADYPALGFATYHLRVVIDRPVQLAIQLAGVWSASKIWIDGELVAESGKVATKSGPDYQAKLDDIVYHFLPRANEFDIIIQAANFDIFLGGLQGDIFLGNEQVIMQQRHAKAAWCLFMVGALAIMAIYHLALFVLRTNERSTFYFSILCLVAAIYMLMSSFTVLSDVFDFSPDFNLFLRLFNFWVLLVPAMAWFVYELFPSIFKKWVCWTFTIVIGSLYSFILLSEAKEFVPMTLVGQACLIVLGIYCGYVAIKAIIARIEGSSIFLLGLLVSVFCSVHDVFYALGLVESIPLGAVGFMGYIFCQSYLLARKFSNAFVRVETSEKEIRALSMDLSNERDNVIEMNQNLERKVDEKTREIRSIMSNIQLGIFTVVDDKLHIDEDYSAYLTKLLEEDELGGKNAIERIFQNSNLSNDEISQAQSAISCSINEDEFVFQTNSHCLPNELERRRLDGQLRLLELDWNCIVTVEGNVEKLLVTVRDATELRMLQVEAKDKREELEFIGELINVNPESFRRFVISCKDFLVENMKLLNSSSVVEKDLEILKVLFINMHTMKGAARSLYLKKMTEIFHDTEQYYAALQKDLTVKWDLDKMRADMMEVEKIIAVYESIAINKLGRRIDGEEEIILSQSQMETIYQDLSIIDRQATNLLQPEQQKNLKTCQIFLFPRIFRSAKEVFEDICCSLPTLAKDLEKAAPSLNITANDIFFSLKGEDLFRKIFTHILRNSMDHGIESPEERIELNKTKAGHISIELMRLDNKVLLKYHDDGRGLQLKVIRKAAEDCGIVHADSQLGLAETADLIFHSGLTTASKLSDISGRGVGMDAVRSFLKNNAATITINLLEDIENSAGGYQFSFNIELPSELFADNIPLLQVAA